MGLFSASSLSTVPQLAVVLGIMVLVHEFGHFAVAKLCGVRVESFAIGFGQRLIGFVYGGTDYRLNLIPLGGYVKMAGELPGEAPASIASQDPGDYQNHPRWQRVLIALAGPIANFILAFALLTALYMTHNEVPAYVNQAPVADYIAAGSPIAKTGMQIGDTIVAYDGQENPTWEDFLNRAGAANQNQTARFSYLHNGKRIDSTLFVQNAGDPRDFDPSKLGLVPLEQTTPIVVASLQDANTPAARAGLQPKDEVIAIDGLHLHSVEALVTYMQDRRGQPNVLTVGRPKGNGQIATLSLPITPALMDTRDGKGYRLGFSYMPTPVLEKPLPLLAAASASLDENVKNSRLIFVILQRLFTRQVSVKALSSPIGMGVEVHEALKIPSLTPITTLMAMISLNLGIFNLLPIPILDGGMILFLAIESAMQRDVNYQIKERIYQVAFVCIVLFAAMVIFNDLTRFVVPHLKP